MLALLLLACAPHPAAPVSPTAATTDAAAGAPRARGGDLHGELVVEGPLGARLSRAPADLAVFYAAEHKGSMETCGCPKRPRGSLARLEAYVDAARETAPSVLVHAGWWLQDPVGLDGAVKDDLAVMNRWMVRGLEQGEWDAINVAGPDVYGLARLPEGAAAGLPLVSANVSGPGIAAYRIVERGGLHVGITGITIPQPSMGEAAPYTVADPMSAAPVVAELATRADVVVLLAWQAADAARAIAKEAGVDVVVDAAAHREFVEPARVGDAAWVYAHYETMRVGELRLDVEDGAVVGGLDRKIDLDPDMPDDPALAKLARQARAEIDEAQKALYGP